MENRYKVGDIVNTCGYRGHIVHVNPNGTYNIDIIDRVYYINEEDIEIEDTYSGHRDGS